MFAELPFLEHSVCKSELGLKLPPDTICAGFLKNSGTDACKV